MRRQLASCFLAAALLCAGCAPAGRGAAPLDLTSPPPGAAGQATAPAGSGPIGTAGVRAALDEAGPASVPPSTDGADPAPAPSTTSAPGPARAPVIPSATEPAGMLSTSSAPRPETAPPSAAPSSPATAPSTPDFTLPSLPLWGRPGLHLAKAGAGAGPAFAYTPVDMLGTTLQPVRLRQGTAYLRVDGDGVYLYGVETPRGGYSALPEPVLLHGLPLRVGDTWTIRFPGLMGNRFTYTVEGIEPVETPGGDQLAARIAVAAEYGPDATEWWVPGYGLVSYADGYVSWRAERELNRGPELPDAIGRPTPGVQALLWDDGDQYWITSSDGEQELFRELDGYWRSYYGWANAGEYDLLTHSHYPGSWGVGRFSAFRWDPEEEQFRQLSWISSTGTTLWVVGDGGWGTSGMFTLWDFTGYPTRFYAYGFDGQAMRSDPALEQEFRARSAEAFVRRLFDPPALDAADMLAMFRDPAVGEQALQLMQELYPHGATGPDSVTPVEGNPQAFIVTERGTQVLVEVERGEIDYQITRFDVLAGAP